jgi:hypothetical protein
MLSVYAERPEDEPHSAAMRGSASPCAARNLSASSAAMQPRPAAGDVADEVYRQAVTAANRPGTEVAVECGAVLT